MERKEIIRLRSKKLSGGVRSLYLDIYREGERSYEFLKLYLNPGNDPRTKAVNKATLEAAKTLQAKRIIELQSGEAGIKKKGSNLSMKELIDLAFINKDLSEGRKYSATYALDNWTAFCGDSIAISKISAKNLRDFVIFLRTQTKSLDNRICTLKDGTVMPFEQMMNKVVRLRKKGVSCVKGAEMLNISLSNFRRLYNASREDTPKGRRLSEGTVKEIFAIISTALNYAVRHKLITVNPANELDNNERPKKNKNDRSFLTMEELMTLIETPCTHESIKAMFLFSCFTGLRISDIELLKWKNIKDGVISMRSQKTREEIIIPLSENARLYLPEKGRSRAEDFVFQDICSRSTLRYGIKHWVMKAGIDKDISFHCARHTFATMTLTYGADLYTVSKLLGHRNISTTQIYAKVVDEKKREAVNLIPSVLK